MSSRYGIDSLEFAAEIAQGMREKSCYLENLFALKRGIDKLPIEDKEVDRIRRQAVEFLSTAMFHAGESLRFLRKALEKLEGASNEYKLNTENNN